LQLLRRVLHMLPPKRKFVWLNLILPLVHTFLQFTGPLFWLIFCCQKFPYFTSHCKGFRQIWHLILRVIMLCNEHGYMVEHVLQYGFIITRFYNSFPISISSIF
jgi:hypothetical protein